MVARLSRRTFKFHATPFAPTRNVTLEILIDIEYVNRRGNLQVEERHFGMC